MMKEHGWVVGVTVGLPIVAVLLMAVVVNVSRCGSAAAPGAALRPADTGAR